MGLKTIALDHPESVLAGYGWDGFAHSRYVFLCRGGVVSRDTIRFFYTGKKMPIQFEIFSRAKHIRREQWNELASSASPMMEWEYFCALEESGSVSGEKGYVPMHLVAYRDNRPVAIAPLYERDRAWVEFGDGGLIEFLTELTGLPYHFGIVGTIPFTPVPGYQFLHRDGEDPMEIYRLMLRQIDDLCESRGFSTSRIYFLSRHSQDLLPILHEYGYMVLKGAYTLWFNRGYKAFDDYLTSFRSGRRTKIKREMRVIREQGIHIDMIEGADAPMSYYQDMFGLYERTWVKHMGTGITPFLNRSFFEALYESFRHRSSFSIASKDGEKLGMALFYSKAGEIYGRYWGCYQEIPFLHFSTCYYHPIDYAIKRGFSIMDPGFGGEHKLIRGYETVPVYHCLKFYGERKKQIAASILDRLRERPPRA